MRSRAFIEGEPVLSGGKGQQEWQDAIRYALTSPVRDPSLTFVVSAFRRRGHPFDLDNLIHPVLMVLEEPIDCVAARMYVGDRPGLLIEDSPPRPPPNNPLRSIYLESYSVISDRHRIGIAEIAEDPIFDAHEGVGLALDFDSAAIPIRKGWFGPTEAVVDDLAPWLGRYTERGLIADHRLRDIRITRGNDPSEHGVKITIWYVTDDELSQPEIKLDLGDPDAASLLDRE